eukprot:c19854_g1_i1 orf=58-1050(+)
MAAAAAAPVFYTIASLYYPGYNLTQRGSHVVVEAEDIDNPFQLWYKDDSWRYVEDYDGNPAFALINNGSKAALKTDESAPSYVSLFSDYRRSKDTNKTTLWTLQSNSSSGEVTIFSIALQMPLLLGIGKSPPESGDGVSAVLYSTNGIASTQGWNLKPYAPPTFIIQSQWVDQILVAKPPHTNVTFQYGSGSFNNELGVVAVHPNNKNGDQEVWYRVPAATPLEDSNSSFFVISKMNGKALKGSTKLGDKVILTEFDPLDDNFVWSEYRLLSAGQSYLAINLANSNNITHWFLPLDSEYQNAAYNHPLTLRQATTTDARGQWNFIPFTTK